ncbi:MAG: hypothetical protein ACKO4T_06000 [Planctomycetaceae bacterium]
MPRNFARYEQFLRVHALYDTLAHAAYALDDASLIAILKQRLGLKSLSPRTLQRDCDFLVGCGYHLDRSRLPPPGRNGWRREIDAAFEVAGQTVNRRLHPAMFVVRLPRVELAAWPADEPAAARPLVIDLASITGVTKLDSTFIPRPVDPAMIDGPDAAAT